MPGPTVLIIDEIAAAASGQEGLDILQEAQPSIECSR